MGLEFGGDWTEQKLRCIEKYLSAYTIALKNRPFHKIYIDAFAGTGYRQIKRDNDSDDLLIPELAEEEPQKFQDGSAKISLGIVPNFDEYVFVEKDKTRYNELLKLKNEYCHLNISLINGDANTYIQNQLANQNWSDNRRAVVFLDPFGAKVSWNTLRAIAATEAIDLWYLFPVIAVQRMLPEHGTLPKTWEDNLSDTFGTDEWKERFYKTDTNLFGNGQVSSKVASVKAIRSYAISRLATLFPKVAENPLALYNSKNSLLYLLCFAVSSPSTKAQKLALKIANHILQS